MNQLKRFMKSIYKLIWSDEALNNLKSIITILKKIGLIPCIVSDQERLLLSSGRAAALLCGNSVCLRQGVQVLWPRAAAETGFRFLRPPRGAAPVAKDGDQFRHEQAFQRDSARHARRGHLQLRADTSKLHKLMIDDSVDKEG